MNEKKPAATLTYEKLAEVAQARRIHTWFEQAWARTMNGVNPVLCAINVVNAEKEKEDRNFKLKVTGAVGVTCAFAMITIGVLYPYFAKLWQSLPVEKLVATSVLIIITLVLLAAEFIAASAILLDELDEKIKIEKGDVSMANAFCADLQVFITGLDMDVDSWFNWSLGADKKQHEHYALIILVRVAKQVLLVQAQIPAVKEQARKYDPMTNARVILKGKLMVEFEEKYYVLQRIGVISGGYDKVFKKAVELIASEAAVQS